MIDMAMGNENCIQGKRVNTSFEKFLPWTGTDIHKNGCLRRFYEQTGIRGINTVQAV